MKYAIALLMSILWLAPAAAQEERGSSLVCVAVDDQAQVYYHSRTFVADPAIPGETYNSSFLNHVRSQFGATLTGGCQFTSLPQNVPIYLRSEEHTSELQSLMRISYAVFCLKKKKKNNKKPRNVRRQET